MTQAQEGGTESAAASRARVSGESPAMVNEMPIIEVAPEEDDTESLQGENDPVSEAGSESESYEGSNSSDVASLKWESDSESGSDSETDSERGLLRYLRKLDGHRRWKGADGTQNDLRDCLIRPGK